VEVTFLGVGEAFDERVANTAILVRVAAGGEGTALLLDCGFSVPARFWELRLGPDELDGVWLSHFHADHTFGLPALLVRFWEERRRKDLHILGQKGVQQFTESCIELAYPGFLQRLTYALRFVEVEPGQAVSTLGCSWSTAVNDHSQRDLALRLTAAGKSLFYSGDGRPTPETTALARGVQLLIHEAFRVRTPVAGHGTVAGCLAMAESCQAEQLALVHIHREVRRERLAAIRELAAATPGVKVLVPEPGERLMI